MKTGKQLATQLNKPHASRLWDILRRSDRKMEAIARGMGISTSQLYKYTENESILPAFRAEALVRESGSVRRELAEFLVGARASGLVVLEEHVGAPREDDIRDQAMALTVDVGLVTAAIREASRPDSEGGERITIGELRRILDGVRELIRHSHELERGASRLQVV